MPSRACFSLIFQNDGSQACGVYDTRMPQRCRPDSGHDVCCQCLEVITFDINPCAPHHVFWIKSRVSVCDWGRRGEGERVRLAFLVVPVVPCISQHCMFDAGFKYLTTIHFCT